MNDEGLRRAQVDSLIDWLVDAGMAPFWRDAARQRIEILDALAARSEPRGEGLPAYINTAGGQYDIPTEPRGEGLRERVEDDIMRRMTSDNPRSRQHDEATADRRRMWRCIPIEDAVAARSALLALAATPPAPALDVERLARALYNVTIERGNIDLGATDRAFGGELFREIAADIAREYAALAPERQDG